MNSLTLPRWLKFRQKKKNRDLKPLGTSSPLTVSHSSGIETCGHQTKTRQNRPKSSGDLDLRFEPHLYENLYPNFTSSPKSFGLFFTIFASFCSMFGAENFGQYLTEF